MFFSKRWVVVGALALSACGGSDGSSNPPEAPPPPPPVTHTIGGAVAGLSGTVVLQNNGADNLTVSADGPFTFATRVNNGGAYAVTVLTQPATHTCTVTSGTGTATANVTQVSIACTANPPPGPVAPLVDDARAATGTVGIDGGSVSVTAADGVVYLLEVPAGALQSTVQIRMAPVVNMGDAPLSAGFLGAVRFEPAGLTFLRPALLSISPLPQGGGRPLLAGFHTADDGDDFTLNGVQRFGSLVMVDVHHFSIVGAAEATSAEFAEIPLDELDGSFSADAARSAVFHVLTTSGGENLEQVASILARWYAALVQPAIDQASPGDLETLEEGLFAYTAWASAVERLVTLGADVTVLDAGMTNARAHANATMPDLLLQIVDLRLDGCLDQRSFSDLALASIVQKIAEDTGFAPTGSPLQRGNFLLRANGCLRVVIDPITLPSPLTVGVPTSLDARARIVFNGDPNPTDAPFRFTVTPTNASVGTPVGFSQSDGRFTTVITPAELPVTFDVRACLVFAAGDDESDFCTTQTVSSGGSLTIAKRQGYLVGESLDNFDPVPVSSFVLAEQTAIEARTTMIARVSADTISALNRGGTVTAHTRCFTASATGGGGARVQSFLDLTLSQPTTLRVRTSGNTVISPPVTASAGGLARVFRLDGSEIIRSGDDSGNSSFGSSFWALPSGSFAVQLETLAQCSIESSAEANVSYTISFE
jgi:hypothetical protein